MYIEENFRTLLNNGLLPKPATEDGIARFLRSHGVPVDKWGTDTCAGFRTLAEFTASYNEGQLAFEKNGHGLILHVNVVAVNVWHRDGARGLEIYEASQENLVTGRVISRHNSFDGLGGTMHISQNGIPEEPTSAALRELREELGFDNPMLYNLLPEKFATKGPLPSEKYFSIIAKFHRHRFTCTWIDDELFKDEYVHTSGKWRITFKWREKSL